MNENLMLIIDFRFFVCYNNIIEVLYASFETQIGGIEKK